MSARVMYIRDQHSIYTRLPEFDIDRVDKQTDAITATTELCTDITAELHE